MTTAVFDFGGNWKGFLEHVAEDRIHAAEASLQEWLGLATLADRSFLDMGSGSGLFSLAARRLGAKVHSLDVDRGSVECTRQLKSRYFPSDPRWTIEEGSVLDAAYLDSLGAFDVVYSWGVLHHTGDLAKAMANAARPVAPGGMLFIAIYNDQGWVSGYWKAVKRAYNRGRVGRWAMTGLHFPYLVGARFAVRALTGRRRLERGMALRHDMVDWLGGYPFEVTRPERVLDFYRARGFTLEKLKTCGGRSGCNEFVFSKTKEGAAV
ncbi:MAG TPA: class I SAM-dependent methyltransferase [Thermoanaerobaculia bacterium]|nr:class I SAM-dependent methyltransferase [Thermoanaerobaculia bacterium]